MNFKIRTAHDLQIVIKTEKILELTVPLMHHPSADWLKLLEMDLMKIIMFSANEAIEGRVSKTAIFGSCENCDSQNMSLKTFFRGLQNFCLPHVITKNMLTQNKNTCANIAI